MTKHDFNIAERSNYLPQQLCRTLVLLIFISATALVMIGIASCKNNKQHEHANAEADGYYTCSMHPQVMQPGQGKCPICGMTLIKVQKSVAPKADEILLSDQQIQLGNISFDTIRSGLLGDQAVLTATVNFNQSKSTAISSRIMGRIERLYYKNMGDYVRKGDKIFDIYSEDLNNAKQEYILAIERQKTLDNSVIDFTQLIESARNKLRLWGLSEAQITELAKSKKTTPTTTFYSNGSGYITTLDIREGDYVMEGGMIMQLADLSTVWVEAQVYTSELSKIDRDGIAIVQIPDMPGKELRGKIEFINPEINPDTRINLLRVSIPNSGNRLKPGMPAYVLIKNRQRNALTLPIDAVIRDANSTTVWVKTGMNTFKSKMVTVGHESDDRIEITSGLLANDVVVTSGAYLINSEYIFKKGANPMAGHDMSNM